MSSAKHQLVSAERKSQTAIQNHEREENYIASTHEPIMS